MPHNNILAHMKYPKCLENQYRSRERDKGCAGLHLGKVQDNGCAYVYLTRAEA